jgi:spermidine synthase
MALHHKLFSTRTEYAIVFLSHYIIITIEIAGFRILGQTFGLSIYTWGAMIGVIMIGMGLGSIFGGLVSHKQQKNEIIGTICFLSGIFLLATLIMYQTLITWLASLDTITGVLFSSMLLFLPPIVPLAMIPPLVIQRRAREHNLGFTAGSVWSIAAAGDLFGILLGILIFIPYFGSVAIIYLCFLIIFSFGIIGMMKYHLALSAFAILLLVPAFVQRPAIPHVIYEDESFYNHIYVINESGSLLLKLNEQDLVHSRLVPGQYIIGGYSDYFLVGRFYYGKPSNVLIIGSGGGNTIVQWRHFFPLDNITGVEIDPKVVEVSRRYFGVNKDSHTRIFTEDGRPYLAYTKEKYDIIILDAYQGGPYAPFYIMTQEYFQEIENHLTPQGVFMINVFDRGKKEELAQAIENTAASVFPSVYEFDVRNKIVLATRDKTTLVGIRQSVEEHTELDAALALQQLREWVFSPAGKILTDDQSDIEVLTHRMLKEWNTKG